MSSLKEKHELISSSSALLGVVLIAGSVVGFILMLRAFLLSFTSDFLNDYHFIMSMIFLIPSLMLLLPGLLLIRFQRNPKYIGFKKLKTGYIFMLVSVGIVGLFSFLIGGFFLLDILK
jgi:hypothetical protein